MCIKLRYLVICVELYIETLNCRESNQMVHLQTNIILLGLQKSFNMPLNFIDGGPYYTTIEGLRAYQVTTKSLRWLPLSVISILSAQMPRMATTNMAKEYKSLHSVCPGSLVHLYSEYTTKNGQDFLDIQYYRTNVALNMVDL